LYTAEGSLFVHHDLNLPELPLCLAWLDCPPFRWVPPPDSRLFVLIESFLLLLSVDGRQTMTGNYVAVGTFDPAIEIWNLDVLDPLEPSAVLGGSASVRRTKKGREKIIYKEGSHTGAVTALSWNQHYRQALASASADHTVKVSLLTVCIYLLLLLTARVSMCACVWCAGVGCHHTDVLAHLRTSHRQSSGDSLAPLRRLAAGHRVSRSDYCSLRLQDGTHAAAPVSRYASCS
jgi:hypothetical protein